MDDRQLAETLAAEAAEILLSFYGGPARGLDAKASDSDLVSDADREAEARMVALVGEHRPEDGIPGEEGAHAEGTSGRRWVLDPLDGTTNFLYGFPIWSVSVALEDSRGVLVGAVLAPTLGELCVAERGAGCVLDGVPVHVREGDRLDQAVVATGFQYMREVRVRQADVLARVLPRVANMRRAGSAALDLAWVACGRVDGYYEIGLNRWDWAAGALLVTEAGGEVRSLASDPPGLVAAGPGLIRELEELVREH